MKIEETGWTDAHMHPQKFADVAGCMARARSAGVRWMVANGTHPEDWGQVEALTKAYPEILPQFGVHPWEVERLPEDWFEVLRRLLVAHPEAGVGEIGVDTRLTTASIERQQQVMVRQVELANQLGRPCSVHVVGAWTALGAVVAQQFPQRMLLHAFNGSAVQVRQFAKQGVWFSFGGAVLRHANSEKLRQAIRAVPGDRLLLETDSPFQHPTGRAHVQEPAGVLQVAAVIAEIREVSIDTLCRQVAGNFKQLMFI